MDLSALGGLLPPPGREVLFLSLLAAVGAGALLRLRLRPGEAGTSLWLVPAVVAHAVLGAGVVWATVFGALLSALIAPGARPLRVAVAAGIALLSSLFATLAAWSSGGSEPARSVLFAIVAAVVTVGLQRLASRRHLASERPALLLWAPLAPLSAIPLWAGAALGDGGLLLALAGLLALLFVVREAANLSTARAEAEAESARLAKATELQDELIHLVTHELRNPLTMVRAYAQLASRSLADGNIARLERQVANIDRGAAVIERLVDNLLELSRLEGRGELPPSEHVDVLALARDAVADLAPLAEQKKQNLSVLADGAVPNARVPPVLLREALSNLVSNAVKYTPDGGRVTVTVGPSEEPGLVAISVADSGVGLSQADLTRLFTKFFRSENPEVRSQRGTGLGLALTHSIVVRMGGRLDVESALGEGSRFCMLVPALGTEDTAIELVGTPV